MELTLIEDGLSRLEKPSLVTEIILSTDPGSFWTLTFILLVGVGATAIGVLLSKIHLPRFRRRKALIPLPSFYSFGEDDDDDISLAHTDDEEEEEETDMEGEEKSGEFNEEDVNQVGNLSSSFSFTDLVGGMDVVKPWEGIGLGFDRSRAAVSLFDLSHGEGLRSFYRGGDDMRALDLASPAEVISATDARGGAVVKVWDLRTGDDTPVVAARSSLRQRLSGIAAREGKVYIGSDGGEVAALDLRNLAQVELGGGQSYVSWS